MGISYYRFFDRAGENGRGILIVDSGWVMLWRKLKQSRVFRNPELLKVWIWCLLKASHKNRWVSMKTGTGETEVKLLPGQFVFGRNSAAKELDMPASTIRNRIAKLKNMSKIEIKPDNHYSVITIINWVGYQTLQEKQDRQEDNQRTTRGQAKDTDNKSKKGDNVNKDIYSVNFNLFWKEYPGGIKGSKKTAWSRWMNSNGKPSLQEMLEILKKQSEQRAVLTSGDEFVPEWPHVATYINQARWEEEFAKKTNREDAGGFFFGDSEEDDNPDAD